ncbi:MAG: hypothetical protein CMO55_22175 [Verrucomicrobiales bacterium]|nr:hypothetical protein [Verrucomicrobiales bacterium]
MHTLHSNTCSLRAQSLGVVAAACLIAGGEHSAFGNESVELRELRAALGVMQEQLAKTNKELEKSEEQRKALAESLAETVRVSEEQMAAAREMQLKLQAFGIDLFTQDENSLQQRLLKAVRDLDISRQDVERHADALQALSEAFLKYLQATPEAAEKERIAAEAAIATAGEALEAPSEEGTGEPGDLSSSRVVSIDNSVGLVVLDAGKEKGLRVGTPIAILRGERPIFTALVVDVRDTISGAVLQDKMADIGEVAVGDGFRLLPHQNNL